MHARISCLAAILILTPLAWAQSAAPPIPTAILNAKTAFLANGGADGGLFPEPFSGDPNRAYFTLYNQLSANPSLQLVLDPAQADLVMEIQLLAPNGPKDVSKQYGSADPLPYFRLTIYDRRSQFVLWTIIEPIEVAVMQKTHDRNFDDALSRLVDDIHTLLHPTSGSLYPHPPPTMPFHRR